MQIKLEVVASDANELVAGLLGLAASMSGAQEPAATPAPVKAQPAATKPAATPTPAPAATPAPAPAPAPAGNPAAPTLEMVRAVATTKSQAGGASKEALKALLAKYNVAKVTEVAVADYAAFYADVNAIA